MDKTLSQDILRLPVAGLNLALGTLADQLGEGASLLVFLRHFGCAFCRETVADLKRITAEVGGYPPLLFFAQASPAEARAFFEGRWADARVVADPERTFYDAFDLRRGTVGQILGLRVWTCGFRAMAKGHFAGVPVGDPWVMPGAFLVHNGQVVWSYPYQHQGDRPDWEKVPEKVPAPATPNG